MDDSSESHLSQAERHVREGEARVQRQLEVVRELEAAGHERDAERARELLAVLTEHLTVARRHLQIELRYSPFHP